MDEMPIILLVEDEEPIQDFVRDVLGHAGVDLTVSSSAEEALVVLTSGVVRFRGLVTDIRIEGKLGGWELARRVREIKPGFPVVYITGAAADQWDSQGVPDSILLQKPFAAAQLVAAISRLLNDSHLKAVESFVGDMSAKLQKPALTHGIESRSGRT